MTYTTAQHTTRQRSHRIPIVPLCNMDRKTANQWRHDMAQTLAEVRAENGKPSDSYRYLYINIKYSDAK